MPSIGSAVCMLCWGHCMSLKSRLRVMQPSDMECWHYWVANLEDEHFLSLA